MERRKLWGVILAGSILIICIIAGCFWNSAKEIILGAGILFSSLVLWSTEAMPMSITTMLMICVLAITNIMAFHESVAQIGVNTSLFIMASSGITIAVGASRIPQILTKIIISKTNGNSKGMIIGIGLLISLCSAFMSSLATCALFNGILLPLLRKNHYEPKKSNLGKCLMIAIPACAGIGGFMSPAGTPANILLLDMLSDNNINISFSQWCAIGFPIGIIATVIFLISLVISFPPEQLRLVKTDDRSEEEKMTATDIKTIIIVGLIILLWFLSGWIQTFNTTLIAVIGLSIMFMPGISLLNWEKFSKGVNWDLVITMGTVSVLMTGIARTGLMSSLSGEIMRWVTQMPALLSLIVLSISICIIRSFIPTTNAVVALLAPMLIEISHSLNQDVLGLLFILAFWTASALLLVYTEPIYLITYGNQYYKGTDLLKAGFVPCILLSIITAAVIPWISSFI